MQLKPELGVEADSFGIRLANGQRCYEVWILEDQLHQVPTYSTLLPTWFNRQPDHIDHVTPVVGEGVAYEDSAKFHHPGWTSGEFIPYAVVRHPVLVEELFFEATDGSRVTRQRFTELVHGSQG